MNTNTAAVIDFTVKGIESLAKEYVEYKRIRKEAEQTLADLQKQIVALMDDKEETTAGVFTVRNKKCKRESLDTKKLKADYPLMYERYTKDTEYTRFTVSA